jgi:signal transduction histidine kinase
MQADHTRIRQILLNLLSNACKFTDNGHVYLFVRREGAGESETIVFEVKDTGIGMSQEQISKLFRPFTQVDASTTRKYGGTGLGLVISRRFCQMMKGDIFVKSAPEKGATFTVRIPAIVEIPVH